LDELEIASKFKLENRYNLFKHRAAIVDGNSLENEIIKKYFLIYKIYAVVSAEALKMARFVPTTKYISVVRFVSCSVDNYKAENLLCFVSCNA
jgi:hypothetical protein